MHMFFRIFLFTTASRTTLGPTQPSIQWVSGALSLGVKRPGREADHLPPSSVEVENACSYTSIPQYVLIAWCLVKHRGQLYAHVFQMPTSNIFNTYVLLDMIWLGVRHIKYPEWYLTSHSAIFPHNLNKTRRWVLVNTVMNVWVP
jgi:hypothetical protein